MSPRRESVQALLHQQAAAFSASMDGMAILDAQGRYVLVNDAHARVYGYDDGAQLAGRSWMELYEPEEAARIEKTAMPTLWSGGQWRGEAVGRRRDGSAFPQEISLSRVGEADSPDGLICAVRDITERKRAEEEHGRILDLEKSARAAAEAASKAKDEFLAVVSHELRTPMTAVLGWAWLLRSGEVPEAERQRALDTIERNMRLQAQIIEDLLDISTIVAGRLELRRRPTDLRRVLQQAAEAVRPDAEERRVKLQLELDAPVSVEGDPHRLQQMFWNLLSNAVKFNQPGGTVRLRLHRAGECALTSIEDSGEGIAPEFLPTLFEPFHQAEDSLTRRHRGLGIGLTIVRHLVELHGGSIAALSGGDGTGAVFTVALPLSERQQEAGAAASEAAPPARSLAKALEGISVLIVDDEPDTLEMLGELLAHCGAQIARASTADEALELLGRRPTQVLVSDIAMPIVDGYSLIKKVRALPGTAGAVRALALTAHAKAEDRQRALEAGYDLYLAKPVEPAALVAAIRSLSKT